MIQFLAPPMGGSKPAPRPSRQRGARRRGSVPCPRVRRRYQFGMQAIHLREVPDEVVAALKRRARANRRSLQGELLVVLEEAALRAPPADPPQLRLVMSNAPAPTTWSREEIYDDAE